MIQIQCAVITVRIIPVAVMKRDIAVDITRAEAVAVDAINHSIFGKG